MFSHAIPEGFNLFFFSPPFKLPSTLHISKITKPWMQYFKTLNAYLFSFSFFQTGWMYSFFFLFFFFFPFKLPSKLPWTQYLKTLNAKSSTLPHHFFFQTGLNVGFLFFVSFFLPLSFSLRYIFQNLECKTLNASLFSFFFFSNRLELLIFLISFSFKLNWKGFGLGLIMELNK